MSTMTTNSNQTSSPNVESGTSSGLPYGSGDVAYAPALAYAMVAKLMGEELKLSNTLKKMQADESQNALENAVSYAKDVRSSAKIEAIGSSVSGSMSIAQGGTALGAEAYLSGSASSNRAEQQTVKNNIRTTESPEGASSEAELKSATEKKAKLNDQLSELQAKHDEIKGKKEFWHGAIQSVGQFTQATTKAGSGVAKSNSDAQASIEQSEQQAYKQIADEMGSSNQAALQTINQFTQENFAAATAIRG